MNRLSWLTAARRCVTGLFLGLGACGLISCSDKPGSESEASVRTKGQNLELPEAPEGEFPAVTFVAKDSAVIIRDAVVYGSVAVINADTGGTTPRLLLRPRATVHGNVWADSVEIGRKAKITGDVGTNRLDNDGTIGGEREPVSVPLDIDLPPAPIPIPGTQNIDVRAGQTRELTPGAYREWRVEGGTTAARVANLYLTGGVYDVAQIRFNGRANIYCRTTCDIRVVERLRIEKNQQIAPAPGHGLTAKDLRITIHEANGDNSGPGPSRDPKAVILRSGARLHGFLHVPHGSAEITENAHFLGKIVARYLDLGGEIEPEECATSDATCDGVDDDCDGEVDEDYVQLPTTCGVGACANAATTACLAGVVQDQCEPGVPAANDSVCDATDNDCDGSVDEDYVEQSVSCGVGACSAAGATQCVNGSEVESCVPGQAAETDESCDGVDNNCDGSIDEEYHPQVTSCGLGACAAVGQTVCEAGSIRDTCSPGTPSAQDAVCDGRDDDCDGAVDEDYAQQVTSCGVGACSASGATACLGGEVVDQCRPGAPAPNDLTCDGVDDDCDANVDEDYQSTATSCGLGVCAVSGSIDCVAGSLVDSCQPEEGADSDTTCDGVDEDCDGEVDEDYSEFVTSCGEVSCVAEGVTSCLDGQEVDSCTPGTGAADDATCDGLDNDCDGEVDEDFAPAATSCGVGTCRATGVTSCEAGTLTDSCEPLPPGLDDARCDSLDNDCDGAVDEDYAPSVTTCGVGACGATGQTSCVAGSVEDSCVAGSPAGSDTSCDGLDDDCDGEVDEDYAPVSSTCGVGACGATGQMACVSGSVVNSCSPGTPAALDATCDGVDQDCDGQIDEDYLSVPTSCGIGACSATGVTSCADGEIGDSCSSGQPAPTDASCNGLDEDCDGEADEDFSGQVTSCGIGACADTGLQACVDGQIEDSCSASTPAVGDFSCDGVDDDCDGTADENYISEPTQCGVGACGSSGSTSCVAGEVSNSCTPGTPAANDALCDGLDSDCDGAVDEDYLAATTNCGVGACQASGVLSCVLGTEEDSCEPLEGDTVDTTCDGTDDDCDGSVDEEYLALTTSCGVGACTDTGTTSCVVGVEEDSCEPGTAAASDATCDGVDNDCDGAADEEYQPLATTCGIGACGASGATSCSSGIETNSCSPGEPAEADALCDGVDEDCDGFVDEEYEAIETSCGVGACAATGLNSCVSGTIANTCAPATPAVSDEACNAVDDDCDGSTDEDYLPALVSCGVGACLASGQTECAGGVVSSQCQSGEPAADDASCNAVDDDCDGSADEEFAPGTSSCGVGACAAQGTTQCSLGVIEDVCVPGVPASVDAVCDGVDSDCDSAVDEEYESQSLTCGVGVCVANGTTQCIAGAVANQCAPGTPAADDAMCNGLDDDCDGSADEDYVSLATNCGVGQCAATGATSCVEAAVTDSCQPGAPANGDAACDGLDSDCDGQLDEDYIAASTSCGVGACGATGQLVCAAGETEDTCSPGTPAANDATCDGVDDDCDGSADEDYIPDAISCGAGACVANGIRECTDGALVAVCAPLDAPSETDASCDGVDNDCDGDVDDDYTGRAVTCGVGECSVSVETSCVDGVEGNTCEPRFPTFATDSTCDGRDEDCDGQTDEDFQGSPVSCGVGACQASGSTVCADGSIEEQCSPGQPAADDASCNGHDDDCDGTADEDFQAHCAGSSVQTCAGGTLQGQECSNGDVCDGVETCSGASCQSGTPLDEDDGNPCTIGACDPFAGVLQTPAPLGTECGSGNVCDGAGGCRSVPVIDTQPRDISVAVGQPFTLLVEATGSFLSYQWYRNGEILVGAMNSTMTIPSATLADNGAVYHVIVSNLTGEVESRQAIVSVGDAAGPTLDLRTAPTVTTLSDPFTIEGSAVDAATGVASVWVENDQYTGLKVAAVLAPATGEFSAEVPLNPGVNQLTIFAEDAAGNVSTSQIVVTLQVASTPVIQISSPLSGAVVQSDRVDVTGIVRTSLLGSQLRIQLAGQTVFPAGSSGEYPFIFEDVLLTSGLNQLNVVATTPEGSVSKAIQVFYGDQSTTPTGDPPRIALFGVTSVVHSTQADNELRGTVVADTCVQQITVNEVPVQPTGTGGTVSFGTIVTVPDDGTRFPVVVEATDCFGRSSQVSFEAIYDAQAPQVSLSVAEAPEVNFVEETPYRISGSIAEPNLAGIAIGNQSIGAAPTGGDTWEFQFDVPLAAGIRKELTLTIWDQAGNREERQILLELDSTLEITWLSPANGSEISTLDDPVAISAAIRVPGLASGDVVTARLDGGNALPMTGNGEVRSATFSAPLASGSHALTAQVVGADGTPKAQASTRFTIEDATDLPVEVLSISPERGATNVEANQPIQLVFSRPVDSALLQVEVTETGRAKAYKQAEAGADLVTMRHPELIEISRANEPTPGGLSAIPGDRIFVFYTRRDYVYTGEVRTSVKYDGAEIFTANFKVRKPPTLMDGLVFDQGMNSVNGIAVSLQGGKHSTTTDGSGAYSFGFGTVDQAIEGGRQLVTINPGQANPKYGALEFFVNLQEGRLTPTGAFRVPRLDLSEPYRMVASGAQEVSFLDGGLVMDLSNTNFLFPGGASSGLVHAHPVSSSEFSFPTQGSLYPIFSFAMNPIGVEVSGPLQLDLTFPAFNSGNDYVDNLPRYLVIAGVDPSSRMLTPVGVGEVNREARTLTSRGDVWLERLDLITIAFLTEGDPAVLEAYANGEASLAQLRSAAQ